MMTKHLQRQTGRELILKQAGESCLLQQNSGSVETSAGETWYYGSAKDQSKVTLGGVLYFAMVH